MESTIPATVADPDDLCGVQGKPIQGFKSISSISHFHFKSKGGRKKIGGIDVLARREVEFISVLVMGKERTGACAPGRGVGNNCRQS